MDDERHYEVVAREVASGEVRPGLWAKALSLSAGDDKAAKALYLKLRAEQIRDLDSSEKLAAQGRALGESAKTAAYALSRFVFFVVGVFSTVLACVALIDGLFGSGGLLAFFFGIVLSMLSFGCFRVAQYRFRWRR